MKLPAKLREIHPMILLDLGVTALFLLGTILAHDAFKAARQVPEGAIEQGSHVALLVALGAWVQAVRVLRGRGGARGLAAVVTAYVLLLLLEEIDYGLIYGLDIGFKDVFGVTSFHQTTWKNEYVWQDKLYWFGAPMAAFFAAPFFGRFTERYHPAAATRRDSVAFVVVLVTFLVVDQFHRHAISIYQAVMYALMAWVGARAAGYPKGRIVEAKAGPVAAEVEPPAAAPGVADKGAPPPARTRRDSPRWTPVPSVRSMSPFAPQAPKPLGRGPARVSRNTWIGLTSASACLLLFAVAFVVLDPFVAPAASSTPNRIATTDAPAPDPSAPSVNPVVTAAPARESGFLTLACEPACGRVVVAGRNLGPTPIVRHPLEPGDHQVTATSGTLERSFTVEIRPRATTSRRIDMRSLPASPY